MYEILEKESLNEVVEKIVVHAPYVTRNCLPGQFVILRVDDEGERIPFTIADYDREEETITIIYQIVGYSTIQLSKLKLGDKLSDLVGPLGEPSDIDDLKPTDKILGIGGGVGVAPLYPQIKKLRSRGLKCDVILGGRNKDFILLEEDFKSLGCENIYITTDDGSRGEKGFVTDVLKKLLEEGKDYDRVIAIGPLPMMKAVVDINKPIKLATSVSLNPIMVDGTGMCGGCRVTVGGETKFACVDGPEFDGLKVDFEEAMRRQGMYKKDEKKDKKQEKHKCRIGLGE